ncbi:E3 ubiquitin-protein ligase SNT2 [Daldinia childiae]|uniref:E3 ubiquitin-protein ligase SNT2 n=1 Tax=Daldinia childiae TaxID=326645 RepID=UPI001447D129|nr:E3 ubiquitin-protein ligase SNT2 [Daldinia childiae]KAF3056298.1 E3 ubiquitin-protein ligase SNT2 [Daldinia childiae]
MAQKSSDTDDQPNPSSSSTKDLTDSGSTHNNTPTPAQPPKLANNKVSVDNAAVSQPMTKSTSSGSNPSGKEAMSGPSPYGTRSRNRGQARPNYAEDKDMDVDMYDAYADKKDEESKKSSRQVGAAANGTSDAPKGANSTSRKGAAPEDGKASNGSHNTVKDSHPTSSATTNGSSATASTTSSKKRKAPAQSVANNAHSNGSTPAPAGPNATKRGATHATAITTTQNTAGYKVTNMLCFEKCGAIPKDGKMVADDGTVLEANDHVYLVCEPPGEPYYLGRIMEFLHVQNDVTKGVDALRINWYYRPKDIGKKVNDTRLVFATMHSDISPLTALRGKCQIRHKAEIDDMETYRKTPDCFWYEKLYDRYIQKNYDVIPCFQIVNVPERVKKVLDERWKYILVEQGRSKEFTSAVKLCKRCSGYCASNDSVDCAVCQQTYHMNCVRPPLLKKPSRGFAWACAACSRAQERKLEARHTPSLLDPHLEAEEEEPWEDDEDAIDTNRTSPADGIDDSHQPATAEQIYHASLWPYRYLGQHCKPEDALDYDDRIYPRAGSRLGPKHQATVLPWYGRPVKLVKPLEIKKSGKKDGKQSKEALAALEAEKARREKRPRWIQDEPPGYVARGEDYDNDDPNNTAQLLWKPLDAVETSTTESQLDDYMATAKSKLVPMFNLPKESTNLKDVAINTLFKNDYDITKALKALLKVDRSIFKEPELTTAELKKFEEGVTKFGSELYPITKLIKTVKHSQIVRFYYTWKKTDKGKQIWGNFSGRKGKKEAKKAEATANKLQDDVADDQDDSAFDTEKAVKLKRSFICKFCSTKNSRQWRRAPNSASGLVIEGGGKHANKDKGIQYVGALCRRCAELWRRYAIQWEDMEDLAKKVAAAGGRSWKRRVDEELLKEIMAANEMMSLTVYNKPNGTPSTTQPAATATPAPQPSGSEPPPRKKLKTIADKEAEVNGSDPGVVSTHTHSKKKEKAVEKPAPPPPAPELPKPRTLPCAICHQMAPTGEQAHLSCKECRLTVHRKCYGVIDNRLPGKWTCDMCLNDKNPQVSIDYKCVLCPVEFTEHDFIEPPKNTHKKKTEKEKEKERLDRDLAQKAVEYYRKKQEEMNRPVNPREPLKRTADNNWVHVTCAVWMPEVKFGNALALGPSEGIPLIPRSRFDEVCKVCKQKGGACVACHQCRAPVHVECAHQNGYLLGFEITPVKGSRRDQHNLVTIGGETGIMSAAVWCKEHIPQKSVVHRMHDPVPQPESQSKDAQLANALQLYVHNYKQADLTLTGNVRKANLANLAATKTPTVTTQTNPNRRQSTTNVSSSATTGQRASPVDGVVDAASINPQCGDKVCITCGIDVSPKWWPIDKGQEKVLTNGYTGSLSSEALRFVAQRSVQCHKCKRSNRKLTPHNPPRTDGPASNEPTRVALPPSIPTTVTNHPPHVSHTMNRLVDLGNSWGPRGPTAQGTTSTVAPAIAAPPLHPPPAAVPPPLPLTASHAGTSPMVAPGGPPVPAHHYPPPSAPYGEWHRSPPQHPPTLHQMNGGSSGPNPIHHNHLRDLRPPPIAPMSHHQGPQLQHGLGQAMVNGIPPSPPPPRRGPGPVQNGTSPYMPSYHSAHNSHHGLTNGSPPPRTSEHSFSQGMLGSRSPFLNPHGSPPISRDGISMSREPSLSNNIPSRSNDSRPASGASANASLRNLLS